MWNDPWLPDVRKILPVLDRTVLNHCDEPAGWLAASPRDRESFGLVHRDAHELNFFVDQQGTITLFDFDDCARCWLADDIAMVLL